MLVIRLLNLSKKFLVLFTFSLILYFDAIAVESVDIWKNEKKEKINEADEKKGNDNSKIDFKKQSKDFGKIKINDNVDDIKDQDELSGLYDPQKNDLSLMMLRLETSGNWC